MFIDLIYDHLKLDKFRLCKNSVDLSYFKTHKIKLPTTQISQDI